MLQLPDCDGGQSNPLPQKVGVRDLIDSVAAMIDVRDRDDLEFTLARVMFELVGASCLVVWRATLHDDEVTLHERIRLNAPDSKGCPDAALACGPLCQMRAELQTSFHGKSDVVSERRADGAVNYVYPVLDATDVVGLVEIERQARFDDDHERLVHGLMRIYRSHLGVLDDSDTDELTGLSNRRPFDWAFRRVMVGGVGAAGSATDPIVKRRAQDTGPRAEIAVIDIDFFKRVNDRFGHPYGDEVLVLLARLMRSSFRDSDRLYRFGGEEFVALMQGTDSAGADRALQRFREAVEAYAFPQVGHVTVSIGVTSVHENDTGSSAFGRADQALYAAKGNGRNQVQRYETLVSAGVLDAKAADAREMELF